jgi:hypothetical protein
MCVTGKCRGELQTRSNRGQRAVRRSHEAFTRTCPAGRAGNRQRVKLVHNHNIAACSQGSQIWPNQTLLTFFFCIFFR